MIPGAFRLLTPALSPVTGERGRGGRNADGFQPYSYPIFFFISWSIQMRPRIGAGRQAPARISP